MNQPHKLIIRTEMKEETCIVYLDGEFDLSMAPEMRKKIEPLVEQNGKRLVLNLKDLQYIDSTGIGIILSILKTRDAMQAPFDVEDIPDKIKRLFDMTGITKFIGHNAQ